MDKPNRNIFCINDLRLPDSPCQEMGKAKLMQVLLKCHHQNRKLQNKKLAKSKPERGRGPPKLLENTVQRFAETTFRPIS